MKKIKSKEYINLKNKKKVIDKLCAILIFFIFVIYYGHNYLKIYIPGIGSNMALYQLLIISLTAVVMIKILIEKKIPINNIKHFRWSFIFILYTIISLTWSININYSIPAIVQLIFDLLIIFDLTIYVRTQKDFKRIIYIFN